MTIEEDVKTRVQLRFGAPGQSNCFQFKASDTDRQFVSDRPSFLPASVVIPDTEQLLVIGGAQNFDGELYTGDATAGWDVVGLDEFVYYKGIDRSANQASRPIDRVRIGAVAAVTTLGGRAGALVIGGAEAVNRRNNYQWGPFEPGQLSPNETLHPDVRPNDTPIFIDFGTGQWHPVDSTAKLSNRF